MALHGLDLSKTHPSSSAAIYYFWQALVSSFNFKFYIGQIDQCRQVQAFFKGPFRRILLFKLQVKIFNDLRNWNLCFGLILLNDRLDPVTWIFPLTTPPKLTAPPITYDSNIKLVDQVRTHERGYFPQVSAPAQVRV